MSRATAVTYELQLGIHGGQGGNIGPGPSPLLERRRSYVGEIAGVIVLLGLRGIRALCAGGRGFWRETAALLLTAAVLGCEEERQGRGRNGVERN